MELSSQPARPPERRLIFKALAGATFALGALFGCASFDASAPKPHATWAAAPSNYNAVPTTTGVVPTSANLTNTTLRHTMETSLGGDQVRVRFSNVFGENTLIIDGARIARSAGGAAIEPSSDKPIAVGGQTSFSVPAGSERWSDPVALNLPANASVAITVYVSAATPVVTYHALGRQTTYMADGNQLSATTISAGSTQQSYYWVDGIDVYSRRDANVLVTFGDSITDGFNSTVDASRRYPNVLARRFAADAAAKPVSVVNAGISGNRVLTDTAGPKGIDRFERDVLGQSGVTHTIILLGINDLGDAGNEAMANSVDLSRFR